MPAFTLRQIVEEESFEADRRRLAAGARRLDAILEGVWLRLSRDAEAGSPIGDGLYVILTTTFPDAPALGITYRFDDETVYVLGVERD